MTRKQFRKALNHALRKVKRAERQNYLKFYDELIMDLMEHGNTEQEAIEKQGSVKKIAAEIMENIEKDKLIHRDCVFAGLVLLDVIFSVINLWQLIWENRIGLQTSFSVIGGTDGPTSIFLAGKVPPSQNGWVGALIFLLLVTFLYRIVKRMRRR